MLETILGVFFEYFWLFGLASGVYYYLILREPSPAQEPNGHESEDGLYLRRFAIGMCLPWAVMGAGQLLGYTTLRHYFRPQDLNPFVLAFLAVVFAEICVFAWWVLFAGGAEKIRDLNMLVISVTGQPDRPIKSLTAIKLFAAMGVLFFLMCIYLMVVMNIPISK